MKKQKICIIGGSLTGLVTAISLSKLNCEIDLIVDDFNKNLKSNRTIAMSIVTAVGSFGYFLSPLLTEYSLTENGWQNTLLAFLITLIIGLIKV